MSSGKIIALAGTAALGLSVCGAAAYAQGIPAGLYVSGGLGANFLENITVTPDDPFRNPRVLDFETGFAGFLALGARINQNIRVEGELSYRTNDLGALTVQNEGPLSLGDGAATAFAVMLNGWFDVPAGQGIIKPYFGGGIGGAELAIEANGNPCFAVCNIHGSEFVFSFQLGAGVAIGEANGPQVTIDYRYFNAGGIDAVYTGPPGAASSSAYDAHSLMIGFRLPIGGQN